MSQKRKLAKKKQRERKGKERVLRRRETIRAKTRGDKREAKLEHEYRERLVPIRNDRTEEEGKTEMVKRRLEHNMQILEALEVEYLADQERRKEVNEELEAEGHETLKDKLDALEDKTKEKMQKSRSGKKKFAVGGSAKVEVTPKDNS
jgi:hypothetical protein